MEKAKISFLRQLHQKKFRSESGLFLVEGVKSVLETLRSDWTVMEVFLTERMMPALEDVTLHCPVSMATTQEMERISLLTTPPEIMALVERKTFVASDLRNDQPLLVLDDIRDPGNLGTIIRTADWFGFEQILCSPTCVELTNPKVIQATMGSFLRMKVVYEELPAILKQRHSQSTIYGTFMEGVPVQQIDFKGNDTLIIGNEANGISEALMPLIQQKISIPSYAVGRDKAESLNASIAAAIVMYQFRN